MAPHPLALARAAVWNAEERRPRAPVRLLGHTLVLVVVLVAVALPLGAVLGPDPFGTLSPLVAFTVQALVVGAAAVAATLLAAVLLDRRTLSDLGLSAGRDWRRDLAAGLALGAGLQTAIFLTSVAAGWTAVRGVGGEGVLAALALGAALMGAVGFYEELWFRGYYLTNVAEGLPALPGVDARAAVVLATLATSALFGLAHATNPDATAVSSTLVGAYGVYLAAGYLLTGDLALPVGFHAAWNYVQGFVYGFPVSGLDLPASLVATETAGPQALTGGPFGPEAGLVGLAWVVASVPVLWWWVRRTRGEVALRPGIAEPDLRHDAGADARAASPAASGEERAPDARD